MELRSVLSGAQKSFACAGTLSDQRASWCLFGGPSCQIGKTFAAAIATVVARDLNTAHILLTYTACLHVADLLRKVTRYLQILDENGQYCNNLL